MKINIVSADGKAVRLRLPNALALNDLTVGLLAKALKKRGVSIRRKTLVKIKRAIKRYNRSHKDWKWLEVTSASGDTVTMQF